MPPKKPEVKKVAKEQEPGPTCNYVVGFKYIKGKEVEHNCVRKPQHDGFCDEPGHK